MLTARRALATLFVVPAVTLATFALAALSPLDPLVTYLGDGFEHTGRAERDAISDSLGLDVPFWQTWWNWMANAFTGDFGASHSLKQPVTTVFAERLPWTLGLSVVALVIALLIAFGVAAVAAVGYALWQTFRADDDLWIADEELDAPVKTVTND